MFLGKHADVFIFSYKLFVRFQLLLRHLDAVTRYPLTIHRQAEKKQTRLRMNNKLRNSFLYLISDD